MKTELTLEQSNYLITLGVSTEEVRTFTTSDGEIYNSPIFTLTDLLQLLPDHVYCNDCHHWLEINHFKDGWNVSYYAFEDRVGEMWNVELIDALYELLIWYVKNFQI